MIGACSFLRRRAGDSLAHFETHWREVHGPLAADLPGVARYLQGHIVRDEAVTNRRALEIGFDGFAQQWFANEGDRQACYDSDQEAVCDIDSLLFIGATARVVTDVHIHLPLTANPEGRRIFMFLDGDDLPAPSEIDAMTRTPGLAGLVEHRVVGMGSAPTTKRETVQMSPVLMVDLHYPTLEAAASASQSPLTPAFANSAIFTCRNFHFVPRP